ncbi:MAG TPA: hypothetical protein VMG12_16625 [Polyangiaceae bacterium]|nr:hypothetical protein [Polyangiaceae bacterium]
MRLGLVAAVALLGLLEVAFHVHFSRAAPSLDEWTAIQPLVSELASRGTLVVVAPEWAEPNARFALGSELMPIGQVARADSETFERALEISILGESAADLRGWTRVGERQSGKFALRSLVNPSPARVGFDFLEHVQPRQVDVRIVRPDGKPDPCVYSNQKVSNGELAGHPTFPRKRFQCTGGEWSFVGVTVVEDQDYRPRQCIWAHPTNRGTLELHFDAVPIGATIVGHGALPYFFERESHGAPVELEVLVGGTSLGTWTHADGEGWKRFEFSTAALSGQTLPVDFRVRARPVRERQFCFQASVREAVAGR